MEQAALAIHIFLHFVFGIEISDAIMHDGCPQKKVHGIIPIMKILNIVSS